MSLEDHLVHIFHIRNIRGGLGRRKESLAMLDELLRNESTRGGTLDVLDLLPKYGCWQDLFKLWYIAKDRIIEIVKKQFLEDEAALNQSTKPSLLAKWLPREGQLGATDLICELVPGIMLWNTRAKIYRQKLSALNKALNTVEIKMCANQWGSIMPSEVPLIASKKYRKAFLNETLTGDYLRHPNNLARLECRDRFINYKSKPYTNTYNDVRDRVMKYVNSSDI